MKKQTAFLYLLLGYLSMYSCNPDCNQSPTSQKQDSLIAPIANGIPCNINVSSVHFTKSINGADSLIHIEDGRLIFRAKAKTDYFCRVDGNYTNSSPIIMTPIDNSKPFTFIGKVTPGFTEEGTYTAGVFYMYVNDRFFQKICFEQDEQKNHRIVTVRTMGTSDDNNHDIVTQPFAYIKISSDTHQLGIYYSIDKETWNMVRLYKNNYPKQLWIGFGSQCPMNETKESIFEDFSLETTSISNFRLGI